MNRAKALESKRFGRFLRLLDDGQPRTAHEIAEATDVTRSHTIQSCNLLVAWGHLDRTNHPTLTYRKATLT